MPEYKSFSNTEVQISFMRILFLESNDRMTQDMSMLKQGDEFWYSMNNYNYMNAIRHLSQLISCDLLCYVMSLSFSDSKNAIERLDECKWVCVYVWIRL